MSVSWAAILDYGRLAMIGDGQEFQNGSLQLHMLFTLSLVKIGDESTWQLLLKHFYQ